MYSTKIPLTNSVKSKPSRPRLARKPWDSIRRPTTSFWTPQISLHLRLPLQTSPVRAQWQFREHFAFWFMAGDASYLGIGSRQDNAATRCSNLRVLFELTPD